MSQLRMVAVLVIVSVVGFGWVSAQPRGGGSGVLTGQDYGEIENLYARYSQGSDFQNAELFLSAFSEDATIVRADGSSITGMAALRAEREERYQGRTGDVGRGIAPAAISSRRPRRARRAAPTTSCST